QEFLALAGDRLEDQFSRVLVEQEDGAGLGAEDRPGDVDDGLEEFERHRITGCARGLYVEGHGGTFASGRWRRTRRARPSAGRASWGGSWRGSGRTGRR